MAQFTENSVIPQNDHFAEAFRDFQDSREYKRIQDKFRIRPFFERAKPVKTIAAVSSYLLNAFSGATAFALVFTFIRELIPVTAISVVFAGAFLVIVEGLKRVVLPTVFRSFLQFKKVVWGAVAFAVILSAGSISSSYFGAKEAVKLLTPKVDLVNMDDVRKPFEDRLRTLQADKADAMKQTWKGKQTVQAAKRLNVIQQQEAEAQSALIAAIQEAEADNAEAVRQHTSSTGLKAGHFAAVTLVFELLLLLCLWYCEFYDFRSLAEFAAHKRTPEAADVPRVNVEAGLEAGEKVKTHNGRSVIAGFTPNALRYESQCNVCGKGYEKKTVWQKFCSTECRIRHHAEKHGTPFDVRKRHFSNENI
jgi:hypothetical protein